MKSAPQLVKTYNKKIATNDAVELIHVSRDRDEGRAKDWAKRNSFPWPTVMKKKSEKTGLNEFSTGFVPGYVLIDGEGNELAKGLSQCMAKVEELSKAK